MATGYEKINAIKSKLKVKQTVNDLARLMGCGPRTIFRHLEVISEENCGLRKFKENGETFYIIQTDKEANFNQEVVKQLEKPADEFRSRYQDGQAFGQGHQDHADHESRRL